MNFGGNNLSINQNNDLIYPVTKALYLFYLKVQIFHSSKLSTYISNHRSLLLLAYLAVIVGKLQPQTLLFLNMGTCGSFGTAISTFSSQMCCSLTIWKGVKLERAVLLHCISRHCTSLHCIPLCSLYYNHCHSYYC